MTINFTSNTAISPDELRGYSRTIAEIEWLVLVLVLLYQLVLAPNQESSTALAMAMFFYAACVLTFRYVNFYRPETYWKLVIETGLMIVFITWVLVYTGRLTSPLVNLYLLVIVTSALTLGRFTTLGATLVIAACYAWLGYPDRHHFPLHSYTASLVAELVPMILVGYITTMLSADTRRALAQVRHLSETDELTGILNRRAFLTAADQVFQQAQRHGRPFSLLMIDSDSLKTINDTHGHDAGNRLLKRTVQCIQNELRKSDVVARYGGDEFVALLPETGHDGARTTAERIRASIAATPLLAGGKEVTITSSVGVACFPEQGNDFEAVFRAADRAMYQSKQAGKNRVSVASSDTSTQAA
jgi:diguanylate cyclase (GGDEF)-like protein